MKPVKARPLRRLTRADVEAIMAAGPPPYDFSHADLSNEDLRGLESFANANFTGSNLSYANLYAVNLSGAQLRGAVLRRAELRHASLAGADLTSANLERARCSNAVFRQADLPRASFVGADLTKANLSRIHCYNADFTRAILRNADFSRAQGRDATYDLADFKDARLVASNFLYCTFRRARFHGADLRGAIVSGSNFTGASLESAQLGGANVDDVIVAPESVQSRFLFAYYKGLQQVVGKMLVQKDIDPGAYGNAALITAVQRHDWHNVTPLVSHPRFRPTSPEGAVLRAIRDGDRETVLANLEACRVLDADDAAEVALEYSHFEMLPRLVGASTKRPVRLSPKATYMACWRNDMDFLAVLIRRDPSIIRDLLRKAIQWNHYAVVDFLLTYENVPATALLRDRTFIQRVLPSCRGKIERYVRERDPGWQAGIDAARLLRSLELEVPAAAVMPIAVSALREGLTMYELGMLHMKDELAPIFAQHFGTEKVTFGEAYASLFPLAKAAQRSHLGPVFELGEMIQALVPGLPAHAALDAWRLVRRLVWQFDSDHPRVAAGTVAWTHAIATRAVRNAAQRVDRLHEEVSRIFYQQKINRGHEVELSQTNFYLKKLPDVYRDTDAAAECGLRWSVEHNEAARNKLRESARAMRQALERFLDTVIGRNEVRITDAQAVLAGASAKYQDLIDNYLEPVESAKRIVLLGAVQSLCKTPSTVLEHATCEPLDNAIIEQRRNERLRAARRRCLEHSL